MRGEFLSKYTIYYIYIGYVFIISSEMECCEEKLERLGECQPFNRIENNENQIGNTDQLDER